MKIAATLLLLLGYINLVTAQSLADQEPKLFRILKQGKVGFINENGTTIIKPIFAAAGDFSEGLAPARIHGRYGFIDQKGNFVVAPQFEFAEGFQEGVAIAYQRGKPFYIERSGRKLFENPFSENGNFHNGLAWGRTATDKSGIINKQGRLVIDTVFRYVNYLDNGTALVTGLGHKPYPIPYTDPKVYELGLVDTLGNFLIPFGRYSEIEVIESGYFLAQIPEEPVSSRKNYALVNPKGQLVAALKTNSLQFPLNNHDSVVAVLKSKIPGLSGQEQLKFKRNSNQIIKNLQASTPYSSFYFISKNRLVAQDNNYNYALIDTAGKQIPTIPFTYNPYFLSLGEPFFIRNEMKWGLMDTTGNLVLKPQFDFVDHHFAFNSGGAGSQSPDYFFYMNNQEMRRNTLWGIATKSGQLLTPPLFQEYDPDGFQEGLLRVVIDNKLTYLNRQGNIIWQEENAGKKINMNIDFKLDHGYVAYSEKMPVGKKKKSHFNYQQEIKGATKVPANSISVIAKPKQKAEFNNRYRGFKVYISNNSTHNISFEAQDNQIPLIMQAQDSTGQWLDVEYLHSSSCGNSDGIVSLKQGNYWEFAAPVFTGSKKTKMRFQLKYRDLVSKATEKTIYSNEFSGSINPGQFWRTKDNMSDMVSLPYSF